MNITKGLMKIGSAIAKHSPELLTAVGIVGLISAGVTAVKNTPKAVDILEKAKEEKGSEVTKVETVKLCWKSYIFPVVLTVVSVASIIFARRIDAGRTAALVTACKVSEQAAERFENATREVVDDKTLGKIQDKVTRDISKDAVYVDNEVIDLGTAGPKQLFFECYSGRYFRATRDYVDKAINEFNKQLLNEDTMTVNEYLDCLGLPRIDSRTTGTLAWRLDDAKKANSGDLPGISCYHDPIETGEYCCHFRLDVDPKFYESIYY